MGRPDLFARYEDDPTFPERFDRLCESFKEDRKIAQILALDVGRFPKGLHWRTIRRARLKRQKTKFNEQSFALVSGGFFDQEEAQDWWNWVKTQVKPSCAKYIKNNVIKIWENAWNRRRLMTIREDQDIVNAIGYIKEKKSKGAWFNAIIALRYLVRYGFGKPEWRDKYLRTKGLKSQPRLVNELMFPDFYKVHLPNILGTARTFQKICASNKSNVVLTNRRKDEFELAVWSKILTGIRTGSREEERELWGTRIGGDKPTKIALDSEGHFQSWTVYAKKGERWHFNLIPNKLKELLETHIAKYGLKSGDFLIQELMPHTANPLLKQACIKLGITPLNLHDLRKAYLTGLRLCGIPLEAAIDLMVGWKKIDTAKDHYLMMKLAPVDPSVRDLFEPVTSEVKRSFFIHNQ